jgi:hypothetical protein
MSTFSEPSDFDGEAQNEAVKINAENRAKTHEADIKWLMSSPRGRRLAWWLLDKAGVNRTSYSNSGSAMAFNEGQRNMGLMIQADIVSMAPERYMDMLVEGRS